MGNKRSMTKGSIEVQGSWLEDALKEQGSNVRDAARRIGLDDPKKLYNHTAGRTFVQFAVLAAIAKQYPTMNMRFVLTGKGPMSQPVQLTDDTPTIYVTHPPGVKVVTEEK